MLVILSDFNSTGIMKFLSLTIEIKYMKYNI